MPSSHPRSTSIFASIPYHVCRSGSTYCLTALSDTIILHKLSLAGSLAAALRQHQQQQLHFAADTISRALHTSHNSTAEKVSEFITRSHRSLAPPGASTSSKATSTAGAPSHQDKTMLVDETEDWRKEDRLDALYDTIEIKEYDDGSHWRRPTQ
ncbi:hypothetical protein HDK77DRAFT_423273 [Phyllosticta capitalensis]|uniref:Uncharacterized protein n=1 Tax=Phyllosticta capitalensis TaxID=121624 RepID=A0ABR1YXU5_9PEZI